MQSIFFLIVLTLLFIVAIFYVLNKRDKLVLSPSATIDTAELKIRKESYYSKLNKSIKKFNFIIVIFFSLLAIAPAIYMLHDTFSMMHFLPEDRFQARMKTIVILFFFMLLFIVPAIIYLIKFNKKKQILIQRIVNQLNESDFTELEKLYKHLKFYELNLPPVIFQQNKFFVFAVFRTLEFNIDEIQSVRYRRIKIRYEYKEVFTIQTQTKKSSFAFTNKFYTPYFLKKLATMKSTIQFI